MPNSTTRENQHQQKFLFSSTTICLTTNIGHRLQQQKHVQQFGDERLAMVEGGWGPGILIMGLCWEIDATKCKVSGGSSFIKIWNS